jgi:hypothetical protein
MCVEIRIPISYSYRLLNNKSIIFKFRNLTSYVIKGHTLGQAISHIFFEKLS